MPLFGARTVIGFDASSLTGAVLPRGLGAAEPPVVARVSLGDGALQPSSTDPNLRERTAVETALADLLAQLGRPRRVVAVLPLGIGRLSLLEPPPDTDAPEYARFRLAPSLPFPAAEAIVDAIPAGPGRFLAGAVRREIVAEYEALLEACGVAVERVDLAPLAAVAARRREGKAAALDLYLGDVAFAMALHEGGVLRAFRCRRRDPGDADLDRMATALRGLARTDGGAVAPMTVVFGPTSGAVVTGLQSRGLAAASGAEGVYLGSAA